jgi:hypothetical protein
MRQHVVGHAVVDPVRTVVVVDHRVEADRMQINDLVLVPASRRPSVKRSRTA